MKIIIQTGPGKPGFGIDCQKHGNEQKHGKTI